MKDLREIKEKIRQHLISGEYLFNMRTMDKEKLRKDILRSMEYIISVERLNVALEEREKIVSELIDEVAGFGPLSNLLNDAFVSEIMVNGPDNVYAEKNGMMALTDIKFENNRQLLQTIEKIMAPTQRRVDESSPYVDASLPDGSRVNIVLPPLSLVGPVITIRKFSRDIATMEDLIKRDTLTDKMARFLIAAIRAKLNIIFAGATGVGKTTTLNVLSHYIDESERIITIEDTNELRLKQKHVVPMEARQANVEGKGEVTIRDLFKNSLRMRPDRIILGEIRGSEALDMLQAISSGHDGALAVLHASSPSDVVSRIETMIITSNTAIPLWAIRQQLSNAIDIIVMQEQLLDGRRKVTHITEVQGVQNDEVVLKDLFSYEITGISEENKQVMGQWKVWGTVPSFYPRFKLRGLDVPQDLFQAEG
ncbi:type II/IV secretion system ATP hydrolase TadA/VirB11/CpaF, TadA subfamily [Candidatus Velamenicoccus archaeovorus]|uniref:Type II/IV secretion system ATP hydrolase TadA/VirB11/CpaF, TadA subfamily n=1 Tax=Velamenicoccus archaeovorus TaxID=1930593 RepID=A0A410P2L5_VELA1|nr:CpaF family protein [Candidatus Velamenicoccus archaeovorus]QAT16435.1 type II/IV secretion system ATP hydrolase TadA/VirB11/CpaF, TadA subfamily [Candidatus Velamenicoccus archaeovorus]